MHVKLGDSWALDSDSLGSSQEVPTWIRVSRHDYVLGSPGSFQKVPNTLRNCSWRGIPKLVILLPPRWLQPAVSKQLDPCALSEIPLKTCDWNSYLESFALSKFQQKRGFEKIACLCCIPRYNLLCGRRGSLKRGWDWSEVPDGGVSLLVWVREL